jgi:hypothetical protein
MSPSKPASPKSLVASLKPLLRTRKATLSIGEMLDRVETQDGPGPVLLVLTLPVLLPLPPGFSMILALPLLWVAPQIAIGRREIWLPRFLSSRTVKRQELVKVVRRVLPALAWVEGLVHPRLRFLAAGAGAAMVGVACTLLAIVLVLPIPFANLAPALALGAFSIGLARQDGLFVLAGYGLIATAVGIVDLGAQGFAFGLHHLIAALTVLRPTTGS